MDNIQQALDCIKANLKPRQMFCDYYDGNHRLAFASSKFESTFGQTLKKLRDNLCPIVVDAVADRMEVINFSGENKEDKSAVADEAWKLWQRELMELISNETHIEAIKTGYAFLIVWPDDENKAKFYLQDSRNVCIIEDEETGKELFAAKMWETADKMIRLTLYYPDRIKKYITAKKPTGSELKSKHFIEISIEGEEAVTENPYGVLPVFKFETNPVLADAIPLQDVLNKTISDRMVTQEFAAFPQRWATGLEPPTDELTGAQKEVFKAGVDRLWFTNDEKVKFGEFTVAALDQFLKAADSDRLEMARVTGTPLHFFSINTSDAISGKALKALESRFTKKVSRLCLNFGAVWAKAMSLALQIEGESVTGSLTTQWMAAETRDEEEYLGTLEQKRDILEVPVDALREEYGYTKEDIKKFNAAEPNEEPAVMLARQMPNDAKTIG